MIHKTWDDHDFKIDKTRVHGRNGYYFAKCACGQKAQAVINHGYTHYFTTNKYRGGSNVISFRVNDIQYAKYNKNRRDAEYEFSKILDNN